MRNISLNLKKMKGNELRVFLYILSEEGSGKTVTFY
jgi:hypothetical protein